MGRGEGKDNLVPRVRSLAGKEDPENEVGERKGGEVVTLTVTPSLKSIQMFSCFIDIRIDNLQSEKTFVFLFVCLFVIVFFF